MLSLRCNPPPLPSEPPARECCHPAASPLPLPAVDVSIRTERESASAKWQNSRDCHSAAPPSAFSRCFNSDGEGERQRNGRALASVSEMAELSPTSAKWQSSRQRQHNGSLPRSPPLSPALPSSIRTERESVSEMAVSRVLSLHCTLHLPSVAASIRMERESASAKWQNSRDCHSAAPPSPFSRCINSDGEGTSANWQNSRERQRNGSLGRERLTPFCCTPLCI